jgi:hypothetical protein
MKLEKCLSDAFLLEGFEVAAVESVKRRVLVCLLLDEGVEFPRIILQRLVKLRIHRLHFSLCL